MASFDMYQQVTDTILESMESGELMWTKGWTHHTEIPHNAFSGHKYSGCNIPMLWMASLREGYRFDRWMTFKQMQKAGGRLKTGQTSTRVIYWKFVKHKTKKDANGKPETYPLLRYWSMFNIDQMTGLDEKYFEPPTFSKLDESERVENAEKFFDNLPFKVEHGFNRAAYLPKKDVIQMPVFEDFVSADKYYSVRGHETAHATAHEDRLNRNLEGRFGEDSYALEELVAELTAAFLSVSLGLKPLTRESMKDHAAYLKHWIKILKKDPKAFIKAGTLASKAHQYLLSFQPVEVEQPQPVQKMAA